MATQIHRRIRLSNVELLHLNTITSMPEITSPIPSINLGVIGSFKNIKESSKTKARLPLSIAETNPYNNQDGIEILFNDVQANEHR